MTTYEIFTFLFEIAEWWESAPFMSARGYPEIRSLAVEKGVEKGDRWKTWWKCAWGRRRS